MARKLDVLDRGTTTRTERVRPLREGTGVAVGSPDEETSKSSSPTSAGRVAENLRAEGLSRRLTQRTKQDVRELPSHTIGYGVDERVLPMSRSRTLRAHKNLRGRVPSGTSLKMLWIGGRYHTHHKRNQALGGGLLKGKKNKTKER